MRLRNIALMSGLLLTASAYGKDLATVDGKAFTEDMYKQALQKLGPQADMVKGNPQIRVQFLEHLINTELLSKEGKNQKIDQTKEYKEQMESASREIMARLYVESAVDKEATDAKLKEYFEKNKGMFSDKEVRASHILFKEADLEKAKKVLEEAKKKGAKFEDLAKKNSIDPSGKQGGDLNFFGRGRMVPEFEKAAFATKKGEIYPELVKSQFGYHIIKVTDVKGDDDVKFEKKKDAVATTYKRQARESVVNALREKAKVKIDSEAVNQMKF